MVKRLLFGLLLGLVMGALVAALVVKGLGMLALGAFYAYAFAAVTGVITGLVAGKPIWASGGQIEAGLKAFFGALLGAGILYALRTWVHVNADLGMIVPGMHGELGALPAAFPIIGALLGGFYELDNTPEPDEASAKAPAKKGAPAKKAAAAKSKVRVGEDEAEELDAEVEPPKRAKR